MVQGAGVWVISPMSEVGGLRQAVFFGKKLAAGHLINNMQGQDDKSKNTQQNTRQSQQRLLKKGGRRPPCTNPSRAKSMRARTQHCSQGRASRGFLKKVAEGHILNTMQGQEDKSKNTQQYTRQSQQGLSKKVGRRPPFTTPCKAKTPRVGTHHSTQGRASRGY